MSRRISFAPTSTGRRISPEVATQARFLDQLMVGYAPRDFALRFWDGSSIDPDAGQPARFTLAFNHPGAVRQAFWPRNKVAFGEAYIYDDIDIEGDADALFRLLRHLSARPSSVLERMGLYERLVQMPDQANPRSGRKAAELTGDEHSRERDQQAIEFHYDGPPSEFYALFLDRYMQYTCGYFSRPDEDIDTAQDRKLHHVCRKLRLRPGDRLIDFGCGWGGLITFAAKHYGVDATGVSISKEQIKWTNREIERLDVKDRCRIVYCDYREFPEDRQFDKAVSVGFIEHLGEKMMPTFFGKLMRLLPNQGLYLHHGITCTPFVDRPPWTPFALKYVFPDGELVPITNTLHQLAKAGFEIRDVESFREHYIYTLQRWLERLEANRAKAIRLTDEVTYRIFRIYFAGAIQGFRHNYYNLNQSLVIKSGDQPTNLPLTRADLYVARS
jgi:cyclopropane-fatty-acyl-phospholipid synthase